MPMTILDAATLAAVNASTTQQAQISALLAGFGGGNVTVRIMAGATLLATLTHGAWTIAATNPRSATMGARIARTFSVAGSPTRVVFRAGTTDVFELSAAVVGSGSADVMFATPVRQRSKENLSGVTITAAAALPVGSSTVLNLTVTPGASSGTAGGTAIAGPTIAAPSGNTGSVAWSLSAAPAGLTATPASGTLAPGASVTPTLSALVAAIYTPTVTNGSGGTVNGAAGSASLPAVQFYTPAPPPPPPPPAPAPSPAATGGSAVFTITSPGGVTATPFALAMPLGEGEFPSGVPITVAGVADHQVEVRSTWPDGSARVAMIAGRVTAAAGVPLRCVVRQAATAPAVAPDLTEADLTASGVTATLQFAGGPVMSLGSLIGVAAAGDATGLTTAGRVRQLSVGRWMSSWLYAARLSTTDAHVVGWMEVRLFAGGVVHILPWVENGWTRVTGCSGKAGLLEFTMGGVSRFSQSDVHLASHGRVVAQSSGLGHWSGATPDLYAAPGPVYLQSTRMFSGLLVETTTSARLNGLSQAYSPAAYGQLVTSPRDAGGRGTANGDFDAGMSDAGFHAGIGIVPEWDAFYLTSGDQRAWRAVIANALGYGRYGVHMRDELTLAPVNPTDVPLKTLGTGQNIADRGANQYPTTEVLPASTNYDPGGANLAPEYWAMTHHPSAGYTAYLLTGHEFFLELSQFVAGVCFLRQNNVARQYALGIQKTEDETVRGQAWALRSIFQAAAISRDGSALKTGITTIAANNVAYYHDRYIGGALGLCGSFGFPKSQTNFRTDRSTYWGNVFENFFSVAAWAYGCDLKPVSGATLTQMGAYADWHCKMPVSMVGPLGDATAFGFNCAGRGSFICIAPLANGSNWSTNTGWFANPGEMFTATFFMERAANADTGRLPRPVTVAGSGSARDITIVVSGITGATSISLEVSTNGVTYTPTGTVYTADTPGTVYNDGLASGQRYYQLNMTANNGAIVTRELRCLGSNANNTNPALGSWDANDGTFPDATSYWGNLQVALAYAVERGIPGAKEGYERMVSAPNWGQFESSASNYPVYAHRPRNTFQWGVSSASGSLAGDVWTPGKDGFGRITKASWATVPSGRWIEVAGTRIDTQLTASVVAESPGWSSATLWGTTPGNSIFQSWSCFAEHADTGRLWFLGGGHSDGHNNGLYRFDIDRMQWAIECAPTPRTQLSSEYLSNGNATFHPDSMAAAVAVFNASNAAGATTGVVPPSVDGPFYDEIPLDKKPTARHTYFGMVYVPEIGAKGSVFMHARRLWRYDIASGKWVWRRLVNDIAKVSGGGQAAPNATGVMEIHATEAAIAVWDEVSKKFNVSASGSGGAGAFKFNWTTQSWESGGAVYALNYNDVCVEKIGRQVVSFRVPRSDSLVYYGRYWVHNLDTGTTTSSDVQYGPGITHAETWPNMYDGSGMVYVPPLNRYWVATRLPPGVMAWIQLDPTTTPWTLTRLTFANASPITQILPQGRLKWIPALNAVLVWDHCFANAFVYKF